MDRMKTNKALCMIGQEVVILQDKRCSTGLYHKMSPQNDIQTSFTCLQAGLDLSHKDNIYSFKMIYSFDLITGVF